MRVAARRLAVLRPRAVAWCVVAALVIGVPELRAQAVPSAPQRVPPAVSLAPRWEARLEATVAEYSAGHLGLGANLRAGHYVRLYGGLAAGAAEAASGAWDPAARADLAVRFLLDPFAERPRGLYGGAGLSVGQRLTPDAPGARPVLVLLAGLEGRPRNGRVWATELSLGGGVRLGLVWRAVRAGAR